MARAGRMELACCKMLVERLVLVARRPAERLGLRWSWHGRRNGSSGSLEFWERAAGISAGRRRLVRRLRSHWQLPRVGTVAALRGPLQLQVRGLSE